MLSEMNTVDFPLKIRGRFWALNDKLVRFRSIYAIFYRSGILKGEETIEQGVYCYHNQQI